MFAKQATASISRNLDNIIIIIEVFCSEFMFFVRRMCFIFQQ